MLADVTLSSRDEAGEPFGAATVVRVAGGSDENGTPNWGVQWAQSDMIQIDGGTFIDSPPSFEPFGQGWAFEGVIEASIVSATGQVAGEGFVTGGGVELQPLTGTIPWTENIPGPGFVLFYDIGGLGLTPTSLTIFPVDIPVRDIPETDPTTCSAAGLEPPPVDAELPAPVEATRQAIAAAAIACDWEALGALLDPLNFSLQLRRGQRADRVLAAARGRRRCVATPPLPRRDAQAAGSGGRHRRSVGHHLLLLARRLSSCHGRTSPQPNGTRCSRSIPRTTWSASSRSAGSSAIAIGIIDDGTWQFFIAGD